MSNRIVPPLMVVALLLGGCATTPQSPEPIVYRCDDGEQFSVVYHQKSPGATIALRQMEFDLQPEIAPKGEKRYGCSVLTLTSNSETAQVNMYGKPLYRSCKLAQSGADIL